MNNSKIQGVWGQGFTLAIAENKSILPSSGCEKTLIFVMLVAGVWVLACLYLTDQSSLLYFNQVDALKCILSTLI